MGLPLLMVALKIGVTLWPRILYFAWTTRRVSYGRFICFPLNLLVSSTKASKVKVTATDHMTLGFISPSPCVSVRERAGGWGSVGVQGHEAPFSEFYPAAGNACVLSLAVFPMFTNV